ncbi:hypothetical protein [Acinetobacter baylyi]|uniref:hypothetical protein n=1 Tax=Acinetobacter baylyi TaxID=202950 RepID=UPI0031D4FFEB
MLEDQIIEKIERTYDQKLNHLPSIEYIQRNIFIKNLDLPQQQYLMYLIKKREELFINIILYADNSVIEINKIFHENLKINDIQNFSIHSLDFNLTHASLWIGLHFEDDINKLSKEVFSPTNHQKLKSTLVATFLILVLILVWWFYSIEFSSMFGITLFLITFLSFGYIWEILKSSLPINQKKLLLRHKFDIASYLAQELQYYVADKLKFDV